MNHRRRTRANLGRLGAILALGALALVGITGCGSAVSVASATPTATLIPTAGLGPAGSTTPQSSGPGGAAVPTVPPAPSSVASASGKVVAIALGGDHSCALTGEGGVKCWGLNSFDELGNGSTSGISSTPVEVAGLASGVTAITAGQYSTCGLTSGGGVKCWGQNRNAQLGLGSRTESSTVGDVVGLATGVSAVAAGYEYACALTSGGNVKCWGALTLPALLGPSPTLKVTPFRIAGLPSGLSAIAAGLDTTCALTAKTGVACWGNGLNGQLGDGSWFGLYRTPVAVKGLVTGVTAIAAGDDDVCALTSGGGVKCWGQNQFGQLGIGSTANHNVPVGVVGLTSGITAIAVGFDHACALTSGGGVKCWGQNSAGQLGNGTNTNSSTPVDVTGLASGVAAIAASGYDTCAITTDGAVKCWGDNAYGQLGDGTNTNSSTPVAVAGQ